MAAPLSLPLALLVMVFAVVNAQYDYPNCQVLGASINYSLSWDVTTTPGTGRFQIQAKTQGWIGLGLTLPGNGKNAMTAYGNGSDIFIGWVNTNTSSNCSQGCIMEYHATIKQRPPLVPPAYQTLHLISSSFANGVTTIEFERPIDPGANQYNRVIDLTNQTFIFAVRDAPGSTPGDNGSGLQIHTAKGYATLNLTQQSYCGAPPNGPTPSPTPTPVPTPPPPPPNYGFSSSFSNQDYTFNASWTISSDLGDQTFITITVTANTSSWVGIGFVQGADQVTMDSADLYVGWVNPADLSPTMTDRWAITEGFPQTDVSQGGVDNVFNVSVGPYNVPNQIVSVTFSRPLVTGDIYDVALINGAPITMLWAYGGNGSVNYNTSTFRKHVDKGGQTINLFNGTGPTPPPAAPNVTKSSFSNPDGTYLAEWEISPDLGNDTYITFTITAVTTSGWVGLGIDFSSPIDMVNADMYVGWVQTVGNDTVVTLADRYSGGHVQPKTDVELGGQNDVFNISGKVEDGKTSITFSRKLVTGDKFDVQLVRGKKVTVLWAYGGTVDYTAVSFTAHSEKGGLTVDLFATGCTVAPTNTNWALIHGALMVISIGVLLFPGVLLARYFKLILPNWFYLHATLQTLGFCGILAAFIIILWHKNFTFESGVHQILGLISFSGFGLEVIIGFMSHFMFDPARKFPPFFPDKAHWWLGRLIIATSLVTMFFGLRAFGAIKAVQAMYLAWVGFAVLILVILQAWVGQTHESSVDEEKVRLKSNSTNDDPKSAGQKPVALLVAVLAITIGLILAGYLYNPHKTNGGLGGAC